MEPTNLAHPPGTLIFGLLTFALFALLAIVAIIAFAGEPVGWLVVPIFVFFALMCASTAISFFTDRHQATPIELNFKPYFGKRTALRWSDVRSVRYVRRLRWFRLEDASGKVARISVMLTGLPGFARHLLKGVSPRAIDRDAMQILQDTAEGNVPSPW